MMTTSQPAHPEWIARTPDMNARIVTLGPSESAPWHYHAVVTDFIFCVEGEIDVEIGDDQQPATLLPGERRDVQPHLVHRITNNSARHARYLVIQANGPSDDFHAVDR